MSDGLLSIKERKKPDDIVAFQKKQKKAEQFNPYRYASPNFINSSVCIFFNFLKKKMYIFFSFFFNSQNDHVITHLTKQHLKPYDKNLKKFNATKALDSALDVSLNKIKKNFNFQFFF